MKLNEGSLGRYVLSKKLSKWHFLPIEVMVQRAEDKKVIVEFRGFDEEEVYEFFTKFFKVSTEDVFYAIQAQGLNNGTIEKIYYSEVLYFEAVRNKLFFYTKTSAYQIKLKLYDIEGLDPSFFRIGKSFAVNMEAVSSIKAIQNGRLIIFLTDGQKLMVSRRYSAKFKENFHPSHKKER